MALSNCTLALPEPQIDDVSTCADSVYKSSPESSPASKKIQRSEGFEIFVGRMPLTTTKVHLKDLASDFQPTHVRVLPKRDYAHLCGFLVFAELEQASGFLAAFNGVPALGGQDGLNVRFADGKKARKKVFIGGLSRSTGVEDLRKLVESYGTVLTLNVLGEDGHAPCGFVTFARTNEAAACIEALHNTPNADGKKNYVCKLGKTCAGPKQQPSKTFRKKRASDSESECSSGSESTKRRKRAVADSGSDSTLDSVTNRLANAGFNGNLNANAGCNDMQQMGNFGNFCNQNTMMMNNMGAMQQFPVFNAMNQNFPGNQPQMFGMLNSMDNQMQMMNPVVDNQMFFPVSNMGMPNMDLQAQMPMQMQFQNADMQPMVFNNVPMQMQNAPMMQPMQQNNNNMMCLPDMQQGNQVADGFMDMSQQQQMPQFFMNN